MEAKTLLFDIEVSRDIVEGYGNKWEFKVVKTVRPQELMCYAYKWLGSNKINYVSRHCFDDYSTFVQSLRDLLDEADIVIAHNGNGFDIKMMNRFFVKESLSPPSPFKSIDTLRVARSTFKFQSNSLNDLCEYLDIGVKNKVGYAELEDDFLNKCTPKVERLMKQYNIQDVVLLEELYLRILPFIKNHPNLGDITQRNLICPKCGSIHLEKRGFNTRRSGKVQRYQCISCGSWSNEATIKQLGRLVS